MTTTFTWRITELERITDDGFVTTAHYTLDANDGTYKVGAYGTVAFDRGEGDLTPFSELTEEIVISWIKTYFGDEKVAEIEATLQARLDEQHAPTRATGLPWAVVSGK